MNWLTMEDAMQRLRFTEREREVARLFLSGLRICDIAGLLYLEETTVKNHMTQMYQKAEISSDVLGWHRRVQLLRVLQGLPRCAPMGRAA